MLAGKSGHAAFAGAVAEPLTVADEEIYCVLRPVVPICNAVMSPLNYLHQKIAGFCPVYRFLHGSRCGQLNHNVPLQLTINIKYILNADSRQ